MSQKHKKPNPQADYPSVREVISKCNNPEKIKALLEKSRTFDAPARTKRRIAEAAHRRLELLTPHR